MFGYQNTYILWVPTKTMKLSGQQHFEREGKKYEKFWITIPKKIVEKLGWKKGQELNADVKNSKLIIQKEDWED